MLKVENLSIAYSSNKVFSNISFTIEKPSLIALLGHNGEGKTTLLYSLAGLIPKYIHADFEGSIRIDGKKPEEVKRFFIFQDIEDSFLHSTIREELESLSLTEEVLDLVSLRDKLDYDIYSLSYGEKHRLAIALSYGVKAKLILMDETFSSLDYPSLLESISLMKKLKDSYIFFSTHNIQLAYEIADEVLILKDSSIHKGKNHIEKKEFSFPPLCKEKKIYV